MSALIFIIPLTLIGSLLLVGFATVYQNNQWFPGPCPEALSFESQGTTKSNGYYNVSLAVNATLPARIDKLVIDPTSEGICSEMSNETLSGLTIYLNRTAVSTAAPLNYQLNSGDNLQVNFLFPCVSCAPNSTMDITVFTSEAIYSEAILP